MASEQTKSSTLEYEKKDPGAIGMESGDSAADATTVGRNISYHTGPLLLFSEMDLVAGPDSRGIT